VLKKLEGRLTEEEIAMIKGMSDKIVAKMIHNPMMELRKSCQDDETRKITNDTVKKLFDLDDVDEH
jgi:glutamyl-tRNA reductase